MRGLTARTYSIVLILAKEIVAEMLRDSFVESIPTATVEVPLFSKAGTHHVKIYVGQPPVPQVLIIDTGSRLTSWLCHDEPERIKKRRHRYSPSNSSTVQTVPCGACQFVGDSKCGKIAATTAAVPSSQKDECCVVKQRYTEGSSWTAYEVNDIMSLPAVNKRRRTATYEDSLETTIPFTFGCQTAVTGLFRRQFADGILGLERYSHQSVPVQLFHHGVIASKAFSLCLSQNGGSLGLGGAQTSKHLEPMLFTSLVRKSTTNSRSSKMISSGMYSVVVEEVWIGDSCLVSLALRQHLLASFSSGKGTILDSGTTDTFLPTALQDVFDAAWSEQTGRSILHHFPSRSSTYSIAEIRALPSIRIVLANAVTLTLPAAHYMEGAADFEKYTQQQANHNSTEQHDEETLFVLKYRVYTNEAAGAVLGINAMLGYDILYDAENEKVGFAKSIC